MVLASYIMCRIYPVISQFPASLTHHPRIQNSGSTRLLNLPTLGIRSVKFCRGRRQGRIYFASRRIYLLACGYNKRFISATTARIYRHGWTRRPNFSPNRNDWSQTITAALRAVALLNPHLDIRNGNNYRVANGNWELHACTIRFNIIKVHLQWKYYYIFLAYIYIYV